MSVKFPLSKQQVGSSGESIAATYLLNNGYTILHKNFKARYGEVDIIARDGDTVVFVEVKTRMGKEFGMPEEAVTPKKLREVVKTALFYAIAHPRMPALWRIDVIALILDPDTGQVVYFNHLKSVTS